MLCPSFPWARGTLSKVAVLRSCAHATASCEGARAASRTAPSHTSIRDGRRRLPIHDAAHVRECPQLRFGQVAFEDEADAATGRADRLLRAAQKHGIMPIGFISAAAAAGAEAAQGQADLPADRHRGLDRARSGRPGDRTTHVMLAGTPARGGQRRSGTTGGRGGVTLACDDALAAFERVSGGARGRASAIGAGRCATGRLAGGRRRAGCGSACTAGVRTLTETGYVGLSVHRGRTHLLRGLTAARS